MGKSRQPNGPSLASFRPLDPHLKFSKACKHPLPPASFLPFPTSSIPKADAAVQTFGLGKGLIEGLKEATEAEILAVCKSQRQLTDTKPVLVTNIPPEPIEELLICQICLHPYEERLRPPVCFPCGHTMCKACIAKLGSHCPFDRKEFPNSGERFPVNDLLLKALVQSKEPHCAVHDIEFVGFCLTDQIPVCSACLFEHKEHDCHSSDSQVLTARCKAIGQGLAQTLSKTQARVSYWERVLGSLAQLTYAYSASSLRRYIELRTTVNPYLLPGLPDEYLYIASLVPIRDLCTSLYQLREALNTRAGVLMAQLQGYTRLPLLDKLRVEVPESEEALEVGDFLQYFETVVEDLQGAYFPLVSSYQLAV